MNNLESFLSLHQNKKKVVVQGLGFVGSVMSLVCANAINDNYAVIGVDLYWRPKKINQLNEGIFVSADIPKSNLFKNATLKNLYATSDTLAYSKADVIIADINLDVKKFSKTDYSLSHYDVDLNNFAIETIGNNCKSNVLILVETTVPQELVKT